CCNAGATCTRLSVWLSRRARLATSATQRAHVIEHYVADVANLARLLSQTDSRVQVAPALQQRLADYRERFPRAAERIRPRHADMPYRCLLTLIGARLEASLRDDDADGYASAAELQADLQLIADSLIAHRGLHAGAYAVQRLVQRVRTFGLHLARLDVRQDSRVHDDALAALFDDKGWAARPADERTVQLRDYASGHARFAISHSEVVTTLYDVFATLGDTRRRYGSEAVGLYIISMARSAADVLAVLALARYGGLVQDDNVPLNIAPLFETVDDLKNAPATLRALLDDPVYRRHLAARGDQQWV